MPAGLDEAAAIVGFVELSVQLFEGCIKGLLLLSKARAYPEGISSISLMVEIQLLHLHAWALEVGLTQQPPVLFADAQYAVVVPKILQRLSDLVSDVGKLKRNHGLQLEVTEEPLVDPRNGDAAWSMHHDLQQTLARMAKRGRTSWKALKWVSFDEQKMQRLGEEITRLIDELHKTLDRPRQARMAKLVEIDHRNIVLNTSSERDLDMIGSQSEAASYVKGVAAAAALKKQGVLLNILDSERPSVRAQAPSLTDSRLSATKLSDKLLSIPNYHGQLSRSLAHYNGQLVLVELKNNAVLRDDVLETRVRKVSAFLRDLHPSFHGLPCRGYVKVHGRYTYVFELREFRISKQLPALSTLRILLDQVQMPSLNLRVSFAVTVLETLLQLHTSGWLHKEFRSDNILFLSHHTQPEDILHAPLYIAGYTLARADDPQEDTEPAELQREAALYRHPASLGPSRHHYGKSFDIFSIGCILLEIGLWCSLSKLIRESVARSTGTDLLAQRHELFFFSDRGTTPQTIMSRNLVYRLESRVGSAYTGVVQRCLSISDVGKGLNDGDLLRLEMDCLGSLQAMANVIM